MVKHCGVKGCKSESSTQGISFHSVPTDPDRRQLWLSNLPLQQTVNSSTVVCSLHFRREDLLQTASLKKDAVPLQPDTHPSPASKVPSGQLLLTLLSATKQPVVRIMSSQKKACVQLCRVCLAADRKMSDLRGWLRQAYEGVSGLTLSATDDLAQLCWECAARTLAAAKFREQIRRADSLLTSVRPPGGQITLREVASIDRRQNRLESQLSLKHFGTDNYQIHVKEKHSAFKMEHDDTDKANNASIFKIEKEEMVEERLDEYELEISMSNAMNSDAMNDTDDAESSNRNHVVEKPIKNKAKGVKRKRTVGAKKGKTEAKTTSTDSKLNIKLQEHFTITPQTDEHRTAEFLQRRESRHYIAAVYKCEICYRGYSDERAYVIHALKHTDKFGAYECSICKNRQKSQRMHRHHMLAFHTTTYSCKKCVFKTPARGVAIRHMNYHEGITYKCPHCPREFDNCSTYYGHMRLKHACAFPCELCGHTFISQLGVNWHKKCLHFSEQNDTPEGPYCETCDVTFASEEAHDRHLKLSSRHTSEDRVGVRNDPLASFKRVKRQKGQAKGVGRGRSNEEFVCELCEQTCRSRIAYMQHFRFKHPGQTGARAKPSTTGYMCEQCGNTCQNLYMLNEHKLTHTDERRYSCECGKRFVRRVNLLLHRRVHDPARPAHACPQCGKAFSTRANMLTHTLIHTGLKPFECEVCRKQYRTAFALREHVAHVHNRLPYPARRRRRARPED